MAYVDDVVAANIFAMNYEESFGGKHFDIGTGTNISLNQIKEMVQTYHPDIVFDYVASRKGDVYTTLANIQPLMNLGWAPTVSLKEGLDRCFQKGSDGNILKLE